MNKLLRITGLLAMLSVMGTLWFTLVEGWPVGDSLYMTVITLSTVGYSEIHPLSPQSRMFVMAFLTVGLGVFLFSVMEIGEVVVRAELRQWWRRTNMSSELKSLRDHYIVCGFGRMGQMLCEHLLKRDVAFVAIDRDEDIAEECQARGWPVVVGDATDDRSLIDAGIERARGLAAVVSTDADNLFIVLSARLLAPKLRIISRAYDDNGIAKMGKAGADRVVSLYGSGATKMAQLLTNPKLDEFFEFVSAEGMSFDIAGIRVHEGLSYAGCKLADTDFGRKGIMVVGIRRPDGRVLIPPAASTVLENGDELFLIGDADAISELADA